MSQNQHSALPQILAIDPDPESGAALRQTLATQIRADLVIVTGIEDALDAISRRTPDLILTATFLSPADEKRIGELLKRRAQSVHTQVIALPQFVDAGERVAREISEPGAGVVLQFRHKRSATAFPQCDGKTVRQLVGEYLDQAEALRSPANEHAVCAATSEITLPSDRRRAARRRGSDLSGQWGIRLLTGGTVRIVDISRLGVLLETESQLAPGSTLDLHLLGVERNFSVAARLVRRDVARLTDRDITYHVAAAFAHEIDILTPPVQTPFAAALHPPRVLGDLLGRTLADANWVSNGTTLCSRFEEELGYLVCAEKVWIGPASFRAPSVRESVSFTIPGPNNAQLRLHAIFECEHRPTPLELRLLEAAANLACVVLELAPSARLHSPTI